MTSASSDGVPGQMPIDEAMPAEPEDRVEVSDRMTATSCRQCGKPVMYRGTGTRPRYCGQVCRQRAYELRRHAARLGTTVPEPEVVREVVERVEVRTRDVVRHERVEVPTTVTRVPATAQEWRAMLAHLVTQLGDDGHRVAREHHQHVRLAAALGDAYAALDRAHPGGLRR